MTDEKTDEKDDRQHQVDQSNAHTLEDPREEDEGGDEQLDSVPDA